MVNHIQFLWGAEMIKYHLPVRGKVTKENAKELYWALKPWRCKANSRLFIAWLIKGFSVKEAVKVFKAGTIIPSREARRSQPESYKQFQALNRLIFGRHYSVGTFENIILFLAKLERQEQEAKAQAQAISPAGEVTNV